jgi:hypothetical protein
MSSCGNHEPVVAMGLGWKRRRRRAGIHRISMARRIAVKLQLADMPAGSLSN